jgi:hypothetical protein
MSPIDDGILPEKLPTSHHSVVSWFKFPMEGGILPVNALRFKPKVVSFVRPPMKEGTVLLS